MERDYIERIFQLLLGCMFLAHIFRLSAAQPEKIRKNCVRVPVLEFVLHVSLV